MTKEFEIKDILNAVDSISKFERKKAITVEEKTILMINTIFYHLTAK